MAVCFFAVVSIYAATRKDLKVWSQSMNKDIPVVVIIPDKISSESPCPVIYLLHGHGGNQDSWPGIKPNLGEIADRNGIIFVSPNGENSWYWDSPVNDKFRYETFISDELIKYIDKTFYTIDSSKGRAITGLSMGGHGAMWNGLRHSDVFGACGSTSGGVDIRPFPDNWNMKDYLGNESENQKRWDDYTVINLVDGLEDGKQAIIFDCGVDDFFRDVNINLHKKLLEKKIKHDYIERPGSHNSEYWNNSIDFQIMFFKKFFDKK
ncbi:MAG: alpha/beta hydrolase family protein [Bacteroidales bacterium]|nr:alpha/beta hydrolase family protein [Bacteroidales bacterium]